MRFYLLFLFAAMAVSCGEAPGNGNINRPPVTNTNTTKTAVITYDYQIVKTYPHDPEAYTQGLEFKDGMLYEGTGGYDDDDFSSSLRKVDYTTGKVLQKHDLPGEFFGEGITILGGKIYQVTWKEMTAFVYDMDFKLFKEMRYLGDGWGLTNDGTNLIMSDGSHVIRFLNPEDFKTVRTIAIKDENEKPIMQINELEFVNGEIWANVYQTGWILRIDPASGKLLGRVDFNSLVADERGKNRDADVLNGIAYDAAGDRMFVTGKLWKRLFEIKVNPR